MTPDDMTQSNRLSFKMGGWTRLWVISICAVWIVQYGQESSRHRQSFLSALEYRQDVCARSNKDCNTHTTYKETQLAVGPSRAENMASVAAMGWAWITAIVASVFEWIWVGFVGRRRDRDDVSYAPIAILMFITGFGLVAMLTV